MRTKSISLLVAICVLTATAGVALGAANAPKPNTNWFSKKPNVSILVGKRAKYVTLFVSCFSTPGVGDSWDSGKITLKHGAFNYNKPTKIATENGSKFGTAKRQVLVTGEFKRGKFVGTMLISGSTCPKGNYTAKFNTGGGSGK
jgi:hypothetical protein